MASNNNQSQSSERHLPYDITSQSVTCHPTQVNTPHAP